MRQKKRGSEGEGSKGRRKEVSEGRRKSEGKGRGGGVEEEEEVRRKEDKRGAGATKDSDFVLVFIHVFLNSLLAYENKAY